MLLLNHWENINLDRNLDSLISRLLCRFSKHKLLQFHPAQSHHIILPGICSSNISRYFCSHLSFKSVLSTNVSFCHRISLHQWNIHLRICLERLILGHFVNCGPNDVCQLYKTFCLVFHVRDKITRKILQFPYMHRKPYFSYFKQYFRRP